MKFEKRINKKNIEVKRNYIHFKKLNSENAVKRINYNYINELNHKLKQKDNYLTSLKNVHHSIKLESNHIKQNFKNIYTKRSSSLYKLEANDEKEYDPKQIISDMKNKINYYNRAKSVKINLFK